MNTVPPPEMRAGDYAMRLPVDSLDGRKLSRESMRRNGCRSIRFEINNGALIAHGYVGRFEGLNVEDL